MRRRLYFLVPDVKRAREMFRDLLLARIEERHIHFLGREGTALGRHIGAGARSDGSLTTCQADTGCRLSRAMP